MSAARGPIRAVTFDFWNTLVQATDEQATWRVHAWVDQLSGAGVPAEVDSVRSVFRAEWEIHQRCWTQGEIYDGEMAANGAVDRLSALLGTRLDDLRAGLVHAFLTEGENAEFVTCPGVDEVVPALADAGYRLGIVCDVGFTPSTGLRRLLSRFGLLDCFRGWSFSDEVRHYKPSRVIFEHALDYLGTEPGETLHIGDIRRTDVAGALGMKMTAVRYNAVADDTDEAHPEAHHVLDHHSRLFEILEG